MYFRLDDIVDDWEPDRSSALPGEIVGKYGCRRSYWPPPKTRRPPPWIRDLERADDDLGILLHEMYAAINADLGVLAAIGVRTVFDRSSELLGVDPELRFGRKLDELVAQGRIGSDERRTLSVLIDAGSAAAHRGWRPDARELSTMVDVVENFIKRSLVMGGAIAKLRESVPPRSQQ